jgi:hypothetical protein
MGTFLDGARYPRRVYRCREKQPIIGDVRAGLRIMALVVLAVAGCGSNTASEDSPRIAPWSSVGSVRIGSSVERVRRIYGTATKSQVLHLPVGTSYANRVVRQESYQVQGGKLLVTYVDGVAKSIYTDNPRYRTPDGIGVGETVSRGQCLPNSYGSCEYKWRSFQFDECGNAWVGGSKRLEVAIYMDTRLFNQAEGRISGIEFGDPNVVLYCF